MRKAIVFLTVLVLAALIVTPSQAQEEPSPKTGFRPDAPPYGVRGPYSVGMMDMVLDDPERPLPVMVWYPAVGEEVDMDYSAVIPVLGRAIRDAQPDKAEAPYPLVIFSHGNLTTRAHAAWLMEHLASYGFVVMAPDHLGSNNDEFVALMSENPDLETFVAHERASYGQRPMDMLRVIGLAESLAEGDGPLSSLIDLNQIALAGYSWGGSTVLAAGGARVSPTALKTWCDAHPGEVRLLFDSPDFPVDTCILADMPELLPVVAKEMGLDPMPNGLWPAVTDPRIRAIITLATSDIMEFGEEGLAAVTAPVMLLAGSGDTSAPPDYHTYPAYKYLGSEQKNMVIFENGDHTLFQPTCTAYWLENGFFDFCSDRVWDLNRAHDIADHLITAFLLDVLKGDPDAHAALLAENVSFPGITYETTMK